MLRARQSQCFSSVIQSFSWRGFVASQCIASCRPCLDTQKNGVADHHQRAEEVKGSALYKPAGIAKCTATNAKHVKNCSGGTVARITRTGELLPGSGLIWPTRCSKAGPIKPLAVVIGVMPNLCAVQTQRVNPGFQRMFKYLSSGDKKDPPFPRLSSSAYTLRCEIDLQNQAKPGRIQSKQPNRILAATLNCICFSSPVRMRKVVSGKGASI